jgi:ribosome-associated protein
LNLKQKLNTYSNKKMNINSENDNSVGLDATEIDLKEAIADDSDRVLIKRILELLSDEKAEEIVFIDAKNRSSLADYLLVCQGRSQLHCRSIAQNVEFHLKHEGEISLGLEGEREGNWVLLDYGNIILHVFHPEIRKYYKLEELYSKRPGEEYADNSDPSKYRY